MADRITDKNLQAMCDRINHLMGTPMNAYIDGNAQIGNYHLSHSYGGVTLHRMDNESGDVSEPFMTGYVPKRELYNQLYAFIAGINAGRDES